MRINDKEKKTCSFLYVSSRQWLKLTLETVTCVMTWRHETLVEYAPWCDMGSSLSSIIAICAVMCVHSIDPLVLTYSQRGTSSTPSSLFPYLPSNPSGALDGRYPCRMSTLSKYPCFISHLPSYGHVICWYKKRPIIYRPINSLYLNTSSHAAEAPCYMSNKRNARVIVLI